MCIESAILTRSSSSYFPSSPAWVKGGETRKFFPASHPQKYVPPPRSIVERTEISSVQNLSTFVSLDRKTNIIYGHTLATLASLASNVAVYQVFFSFPFFAYGTRRSR